MTKVHTPNKFTEAQIHDYLRNWIVSLQDEEKLNDEQQEKVPQILEETVYTVIGHPEGWPDGEYLAVYWHHGPLEIFSIHKDGLKSLTNREFYDPISRLFKEERII